MNRSSRSFLPERQSLGEANQWGSVECTICPCGSGDEAMTDDSAVAVVGMAGRFPGAGKVSSASWVGSRRTGSASRRSRAASYSWSTAAEVLLNVYQRVSDGVR